MFSFFKKKKQNKDTPSTIEGKSSPKPAKKASKKPSESRKGEEKGKTTGKPRKAPVKAPAKEKKEVGSRSQEAMKKHIQNARSGVPISQQELISAPFIGTSSKINLGLIKIADMTDEDYKKHNITKREMSIKAWSEYQRRFKIEPSDFKRKNIDNSIYVVVKDINILTKQYAKHIIFKGSMYSPTTGKVKLGFTNTKDLYNFIINNMKDYEIRSPIVNLLLAIEIFNIINDNKRLNFPPNLEKYYRERYNQKVINLNMHKLNGKTKQEILSSYTDFEINNDSTNEVYDIYKKEVQELHSGIHSDENKEELKNKIGGMSEKMFKAKALTDKINKNESIDISKKVMEAIESDELENKEIQEESRSKTNLEVRYEEKEARDREARQSVAKIVSEDTSTTQEKENEDTVDFNEVESILTDIANDTTGFKHLEEMMSKLEGTYNPDKESDQKEKSEVVANFKSNDNKENNNEDNKERTMEEMDFEESYVESVTNKDKVLSSIIEQDSENDSKVIEPTKDNVIPFIDNKKEEQVVEEEQVEATTEEDYEVLEDITKDPFREIIDLDIPVFSESKKEEPVREDVEEESETTTEETDEQVSEDQGDKEVEVKKEDKKDDIKNKLDDLRAKLLAKEKRR